MISAPGLNLAFLKKEPYSGSASGKRFYVCKSEEGLMACVYKEPWCYEVTPEEDKIRKEFPFTKEGLEEALEWMDETKLD